MKALRWLGASVFEVMQRFGGRFPWAEMVSRTYTLEQVAKALADVEARRVVKAVILPNG